MSDKTALSLMITKTTDIGAMKSHTQIVYHENFFCCCSNKSILKLYEKNWTIEFLASLLGNVVVTTTARVFDSQIFSGRFLDVFAFFSLRTFFSCKIALSGFLLARFLNSVQSTDAYPGIERLVVVLCHGVLSVRV